MITDYVIEREDRRQPFRPRLHFTAPYGWINDPNGLIYFKGLYHIFYQHLPEKLDWVDVKMYWGHAVSKDLLNWSDLPVALAPDQPYEDYPGGGCWSGSAIEWQEKLYLFYTGCVGEGDTLRQTQNLAVSEDGVHFEKYAGNPIIPIPPAFGGADFRDPKVFRQNESFYLVAAGSVPKVGDGSMGCVYLYKSQDLYHWEYTSTIIGPTEEYGEMFECPDFFPLGDQWVLSVCLMKNANHLSNAFFVGDMDFENGKFHINRMQTQDLGGYWFAPQTFEGPDGRRVQICWQNTCLWMQWFNDWGPTQAEGWRSCLSLPHILTLDAARHIHSAPISIAGALAEDLRTDVLPLGQTPVFLHPADPLCFELRFTVVPEKCFSGVVEVGVAGRNEKYSRLSLDLVRRKMILAVNDCRSPYGNGTVLAELPDTREVDVRIQLDHSSLEICFNDDTHCVACVYPEETQNELWIRTPYTTAQLENVRLASLRR